MFTPVLKMANDLSNHEVAVGAGGLLSLAEELGSGYTHVFFSSSEEDDDFEDVDMVDVPFYFQLPSGRSKTVASAQVQAFVIKYIEEWGETPSDTNLQFYIDNLYQMHPGTLRENCFILMELHVDTLDQERQTELLTQRTQYEAPSPKPLKNEDKKHFQQAVKTIYATKSKNKKKNKEDEDICIICMESVESGKMKKVQIKNCKHKFHQTCLQKWVSCSWCCPMCKQPL